MCGCTKGCGRLSSSWARGPALERIRLALCAAGVIAAGGLEVAAAVGAVGLEIALRLVEGKRGGGERGGQDGTSNGALAPCTCTRAPCECMQLPVCAL